MKHTICDECETVEHCSNNGCIPKQSENVAGVNTLQKRVAETAKNVHEQPTQQQEPVAYVQHWCTYCQGHNAHNCQFNTRLPRVHTYTTNNTSPPPRKPWVGLTEEDYVLISQLCEKKLEAAEYAEHLLREKNT